jgi:hypothetical protein
VPQSLFAQTARWASPLLVFVALSAAACGTKSQTSTGPSPVKCQVSLSLPQNAIEAKGGVGTLSVTAPSECAWAASASVSWISALNPASGQGQGQIQFQVAPNLNAASRQGDIMLNGVTARVSQMGATCQIDLTPRTQNVPAGTATGTFSVSAPAGCGWSATSNDAWITITSGATGSGDGSVGFSVGANSGAARIGTIGIGGQTFAVSQSSPTAPSCSYAIQPASTSLAAAGATASITIQAGANCSWTAASNVSWLAVVGVGTGSGNGSVTISAPANTGSSARTGTMTIAGQTLTVTQAGLCTPTINPASQSIAVAGGAGTAVSVAVAAPCAWTATSNASWLTITTGASGTGNGQVLFSATANPGPARSGTLTIAGLTFTVNQAGSCAASISPASQTIGSAGGAATQVGVTIAAGCGWTATAAVSWITITSGASGNGNGTVGFTVAANTGAARTGTISIAGQTHTVTQSTPCTYSINASSQSLNKGAQKGKDIAVSASTGCAWTAVANDSWITITSGASGSGDGTVKWTVSQNTGNSPRTGTMTIAGFTFTVTQSDK